MSRISLFLSLLAFSAAPAFTAPTAPPTATPALPPALAIPNTPANWAQTLERIATGVVTIQIDSTRAFDTEWNTTAQATGFVFDANADIVNGLPDTENSAGSICNDCHSAVRHHIERFGDDAAA